MRNINISDTPRYSSGQAGLSQRLTAPVNILIIRKMTAELCVRPSRLLDVLSDLRTSAETQRAASLVRTDG
jgi:hypothetical protein